jgi:hypothetical protein
VAGEPLARSGAFGRNQRFLGKLQLQAKRSSILAAAGPVLQQLENDAGLRLAPSLKLEALRAVTVKRRGKPTSPLIDQ